MFGDDDNDDVCTWYISEQQREEGGGSRKDNKCYPTASVVENQKKNIFSFPNPVA